MSYGNAESFLITKTGHKSKKSTDHENEVK
jgi:hypothetical protein